MFFLFSRTAEIQRNSTKKIMKFLWTFLSFIYFCIIVLDNFHFRYIFCENEGFFEELYHFPNIVVLSCPCCHVLAVMSSPPPNPVQGDQIGFRSGCPIPALRPQMSCPGYPVPALRYSWPQAPVPAVLSCPVLPRLICKANLPRQTCLGYPLQSPAMVVPPQLSRPGRHVPSLLSWLYYPDCPLWLSYQAVLAFLLCSWCPFPGVLWLFYIGCLLTGTSFYIVSGRISNKW